LATGEEREKYIYNTEVLHDKLEDISWAEDQPWEETLAITSSAPTQVEDVDDDLERELAFYNQVRRRGNAMGMVVQGCHAYS
jgi:Eukaryotic rRNA processing protein EBP2